MTEMNTNGWIRYQPTKHECVADGDECPACAENAVDRLVWDADGETVTCAVCGTVYTPCP